LVVGIPTPLNMTSPLRMMTFPILMDKTCSKKPTRWYAWITMKRVEPDSINQLGGDQEVWAQRIHKCWSFVGS
jgi:hypothetical protein